VNDHPHLVESAAAATEPDAALPALVPRAVLFGNPERAAPRISPDATRLAYLAPSPEGVLNVWVRSLSSGEAEQVTRDTVRGIRYHEWTEDGQRLIYVQDSGGDENWHVFLVELATRKVTDLTPYPGVRVDGVTLRRRRPAEMLVALNLRDRGVFDMHRLDILTGRIELDTQNPGDVVRWFADAELQVRAAVSMDNEDGSSALRVREAPEGPWREILRWPFGEHGALVDFSADGRVLYVQSSLGSDTTRLLRLDAASGAELETLAADPRADIARVQVHPETHEVEAVAIEEAKLEWTVLAPSVAGDFERLERLTRGTFSVLSRDHADAVWVVADLVDDGPVVYSLYRRAEGRLERLFVDRPKLEGFRLARTEPVRIRARDGLELVAYLTCPPGVEPRGLPMVLDVHGGPWARDSWGFHPEVQWFASRGYACLQVNYRGSTGFGKRFLHAADGQWGIGTMQDDLTDAVRWAVAEGIADPGRVGIYGGSYGGYATLAGLVFTPGLYACGVDIVGVSHLRTFFQSIPPYWKTFRKQLELMVGDMDGDEELNRRHSPIYHVENIRAPLLIAQGANDPRVHINESDQMVQALRGRGLSVGYVVYPDEGHGFVRPENRMDFYGRAEEFLARHLGGRAEPWHPVEGSSAELR
jgi:dipeptidyl aminopeptidase/acylaminoacyl peptidase